MGGIPRGLDAKLKPWTIKAIQVLEDGRWHNRDEVTLACSPLVPPGQAIRVAERNRLAASHSGNPRSRHLDRDHQIYIGSQAVIKEALHNRILFEVRALKGVAQVRLTPTAIQRARFSGVIPPRRKVNGKR